MMIKKQLLKRDANGNLVDDILDSADSSIEAEYCRILTKNYDILGKSFPEFLRLKEILKLSAIFSIL